MATMMARTGWSVAALAATLAGLSGCCGGSTCGRKPAAVKWITLDPGHFHAALVQQTMYPGVDPEVRVYAPEGPDLRLHLQRIEGFNRRAENPTRWIEKVYTGPDFLEKMIAERAGNVVVISGNNARKPDYILASIQAGFHVLADKPMVINPEGFEKLKTAFQLAQARGRLLYDVMTERYEITTMLQRALAQHPSLFGTLDPGTPDDPSVTKESVHHFFKTVAGRPLQRPPWFFDTAQQGEAIVDVTTHLVDLVQWECFPGVTLSVADVHMLKARRWNTPIRREEFARATNVETYPDYLKPHIDSNDVLRVCANGEFTYTLRGVHAKVSVRWNFEPPPGTGDTHSSLLRGTRAALIIRQDKAQNYKPTLYVEPRAGLRREELAPALESALAEVNKAWPGVTAQPDAAGWEIVIPDHYKVGHEPHFAQVAEKYLRFLAKGDMPAWEVPNMLVKYHTLMEAYRMSR